MPAIRLAKAPPAIVAKCAPVAATATFVAAADTAAAIPALARALPATAEVPTIISPATSFAGGMAFLLINGNRQLIMSETMVKRCLCTTLSAEGYRMAPKAEMATNPVHTTCQGIHVICLWEIHSFCMACLSPSLQITRKPLLLRLRMWGVDHPRFHILVSERFLDHSDIIAILGCRFRKERHNLRGVVHMRISVDEQSASLGPAQIVQLTHSQHPTFVRLLRKY